MDNKLQQEQQLQRQRWIIERGQKHHDKFEELQLKLGFHYQDLIVRSVEKAQALNNFIVLLSLTIVGAIIPLLISNERVSEVYKKLLVVPLVLFTFEIIGGLIIQIKNIKKELKELPEQLFSSSKEWTGDLAVYQKFLDDQSEENLLELQKMFTAREEKIKQKERNLKEKELKVPLLDYLVYGTFFFGIFFLASIVILYILI